MALDTNIALGIKPIEQPNMLAQMGQMMQLRSAQQEYEGQNALRDAFASGGSLSDPTFVQRLRAANPKMAFDLEAKHLAGEKTKSELLDSAYKMSREYLTMVNSPEGLREYTINQFNDPVIGPSLKRRGLTPEKVLADLDKNIATLGFNTVLKKSAMGLEKFYSDETSRVNAATAAASGNRNASVAEQKWAQEQKQQAEIDKLMGGGASSTTPMTFGGGGGGSSIMNPPPTNALIQGSTPSLSPNMMRPDAQAPAAAPAPVAATGDVYDQIKALDAKIAPLVNSGNPRATAIVQQLIAQRTQLLASAKQQYGGAITSVEVPDPTTGQPTLIQMRPDERGVLRPVKQGDVPLSVDATAGSNLTIDPSVARPAPSATVLKERQATQKLPEAIAMNTDAIRKIDEMIGGVDAKGKPLAGKAGQPHPGFSEAVGFGFGTSMIPGTQGKSFSIRHKEVLSQAFLDAFEALKGGGAITEKEGEKATAARTRMDLAQSESEYKAAAREYQGVLKRGVENAKARIQRSGGAVPTPAATATPETSAAPVIKSEAEYTALPSGATYVDPDGITRRKK